MESNFIYCGCGCGELIKNKRLAPSQIRNQGPIRYKPGHQSRGLKHSAEHIAKTTNKLEKNGRWKGGRILDHDGYVLIKMPQHPFSNNHGYIREHRVIIENFIGRYLLASEIVHHTNGDKTDNRRENLEIVNTVKHGKITNIGTKKPRANGIYFICLRCGKTFYKGHYFHNQIVKFCSWQCRYPS